MTTFCDDHEWCSDDDSAMCPYCLATWGDLHEDRPVMKEPCRDCGDTGWFYGERDLGPCLCTKGRQK